MQDSKICQVSQHNYFPVYKMDKDRSTISIMIACSKCGDSKELKPSDHTEGEE